MTPDEIRQQLFAVGRELSKAASAIEELEVASERAEIAAQSRMDAVFLTAEGSVEDRKARARVDAERLRDAAVVARAAWSRARLKAKHLELEQMRLLGVLKSIMLEGA